MGILTFSQIKSEIKEYHANRSDLDDTRLNRVIDLAQMRIARMKNWDELNYTFQDEFVISGTDTRVTRRADRIISLRPFDHHNDGSEITNVKDFRVRSVYSFKVVDPNSSKAMPLTGLTVQKFDSRWPDVEFSSRSFPVDFCWFADRTATEPDAGTATASLWYKAAVAPAPDIAYQYEVRLNTFPRYLNVSRSDSDASDLEDKDDAIINLSTSMIYASLGREDKADKYFGYFGSIMRDAMNLDNEDFHEAIVGIRVHTAPDGISAMGPIGEYWNNPFFLYSP